MDNGHSIKLFFQETLISTLLGGYYYDSDLSLAINTIHTYLWAIFFILPYAFRQIDNKIASTVIYGVVIFTIFTILKLINYKFHTQIDHKERMEDEKKKGEEDQEKEKEKKSKKDENEIELETDNDQEKKTDNKEDKDKNKDKDNEKDEKEKDNEIDLDFDDSDNEKDKDDKDEKDEKDEKDKDEKDQDKDKDEPKPKKKRRVKKEVVHSYFDEFGVEQHYTIFTETSETEPDEKEPDEKKPDIPIKNEGDDNKNPSNPTFDYRDFITDDMSVEEINRIIYQREHRQRDPFGDFHDQFVEQRFDLPNNEEPPQQPKEEDISRVWLTFCGKKHIWKLDRRVLEMCFDRDLKKKSFWISIILATIAAVLVMIASYEFYDLEKFFLFISVATGHYCLLKSVQPDCHSPEPDNRRVIYSRAFYIAFFSALVLITKAICDSVTTEKYQIFQVQINFYPIFSFLFNVFKAFLMALPLFFLFGIFSQPTTLIIYLCEQFHIQIMGGTAITHYLGIVYQLLLDIIFGFVLFGIGYNALGKSGEFWNNYSFSFFCGFIIGFAYLASRLPNNPRFFHAIFKPKLLLYEKQEPEEKFYFSPLRKFLFDVLIALIIGLVYTGLHQTKMFSKTKRPDFLWIIAIVCGFIVHILIPQMRKAYPFSLFRNPILRSPELKRSLLTGPAKYTYFEIIYKIYIFLEKYIIFPFIILFALTDSIYDINSRGGRVFASILTGVLTFKFIRTSFHNSTEHFKYIVFCWLLFDYDLKGKHVESLVVNLYASQYLVDKIEEFVLKFKFYWRYLIPLNQAIASLVHIYLQAFGLAHSALEISFIILSTVFSTPISPLFGSSLFLLTYARSVKYWERSYRTHRIDDSRVKLSSALGIDSTNFSSSSNIDNLNAIFYEHLYVSLTHSLYDDIAAGRLGSVKQGDFFFLINDKLTSFLHVIELGNGFCSFQLRGLEFRGTFCQERELEKIKEPVDDNLRNAILPCLPVVTNKEILQLRLFTWESLSRAFVARTYNVIQTATTNAFSSFDFRKKMITYYVSAAIYYLIKTPGFYIAIRDEEFTRTLRNMVKKDYIDSDIITFSSQTDEDYDKSRDGISIASFEKFYSPWIRHCLEQNPSVDDIEEMKYISLEESTEEKPAYILGFCFVVSILARRLFATANLHQDNDFVVLEDNFLEKYYALFRGDFRVSNQKDEWVFYDMSLLENVIKKAATMTLKLQKNYFIMPTQYNDPEELYNDLEEYNQTVLACAESDPRWRQGIVEEQPNLISIRRQKRSRDDTYEYFMMELELKYLKFLAVKVNQESVRGLWSSQIQELVYFKNENAERGSIQRCEAIARNLICQSCDWPTGYPISISPILVSFSSSPFYPFSLRSNFRPKNN